MKRPGEVHRGGIGQQASKFLIVVIAAVGLGANSPGLGSDSSTIIWRSQRMCGVNCLYALLKAHGLKATYDDITDEVLATQADTSLTDIKRSATRHGLPCEIGKTGIDGLSAMAKPVVAHCEMIDPTGTQAGHFVLVVRTTPEGVLYLDGTTAQLIQLNWREFQQRWSGYLVYPSAGTPWSTWAMLLASIPFGVGMGLLVDRIMFRRGTQPRRLASSELVIAEN